MARVLRSAAAAGGVVIVLALPGLANASSVALSGSTLNLSGHGGETNDLRVASSLAGTEITDAVPITAGAGCVTDVLNSRHAICQLATPALVQAVLGDRNDAFTLSQNVPAAVDGGSGGDQITTAGGHDTVYARDNEFDSVGCGTGTDTVYADRGDLVGASCENLSVPPAPPAPEAESPGPADIGGGSVNRAPTRAPRQQRGFLRLPRTPTVEDLVNDRFAFSVRCVIRCDVQSKLTADTATKVRMRLRKRVVGRGGGEVGAGRTVRLPIRLLAKASGRLRRARKIRLRLTSIFYTEAGQAVYRDIRTVKFVRARTARKRKR